jgi:DNA-binding NarL/FixJ family response regulator
MATFSRILLVDDHAVAREGAAQLLRLAEPGVTVLQAGSVEEGRRQVREQAPELVFLDLRFDDELQGGLALLRWMKAEPAHDRIPVMVMSGETLDRKAVEALLGEGAAGYLAKGKAEGAAIFGLALQLLQAGGVFIHGAKAPQAGGAVDTPPAAGAANLPELIPSHRRVLVRHVRGMPYKSIARELGISEAVVKEYVSDLCRRFKVDNAKALIYEIARRGVRLDAE